MRPNKLAIVVPCYNEEETLQNTINHLSKLLDKLIEKDKISKNSNILLVNDGSKDKTWNIIEENFNKNNYVVGIKLSHNVGHQNALYAGLESTKELYDMTISIDADLQDDINVIEDMIDSYHNGNEIVYGVRNDRTSDSFFKKATAESFYKIIEKCGVETIYNHADFRLMSKLAVENLCKYEESNLYLRGIVPKIGFKNDKIEYKRKEREAGCSKYNLKSMLKLAIDGITSFSNKPLDLLLNFSIFLLVMSFLTLFVTILLDVISFNISMTVYILHSIWIIGSIQLCAISLIGQYIGRINLEVKKRPRYIIEKYLKK